MVEFDTPREDFEAIRDWFRTWGGNVAAVNFTASRPLFDERAVGFGTWMDRVEGLDSLEAKQWRSIWPTIDKFHHDTDTLKAMVSPDRLMAFGMLVWTSTGFHEDGTSYDRPGRTTAIFIRDAVADPWRCVHTHVSLFRGVPQKSYGNRPETF